MHGRLWWGRDLHDDRFSDAAVVTTRCDCQGAAADDYRGPCVVARTASDSRTLAHAVVQVMSGVGPLPCPVRASREQPWSKVAAFLARERGADSRDSLAVDARR